MEATKAAPPIIEFSFTNLELPFASIRTDCLVESKVFRSTGKAAAEAGFVRANILAAILAISIPLRAASKILKKVNGKVERKKDREKINIRFDGEAKFTLQHVFVKWLFTLNADTDFEKSSAIDIADYYLANRQLRDDKLSKEEKAELKANARIEGEKLFSKFLHEVLAFDDQHKLNYAWNRMYNGQIIFVWLILRDRCNTYKLANYLRGWCLVVQLAKKC